MKENSSKQLENVRAALQKLENIGKTLEQKIKELDEKGIVTLLDAEHELKTFSQEIFGDLSETRKIQEIVVNYLLTKLEELKKAIHDTYTNRKDYLQTLFKVLENPEVNDDSIKHTDSFGGFSNEVPARFGLENELLKYVINHPEKRARVTKKIYEWIKGNYAPIVQSSGFRLLTSIQDYFSQSLKEKANKDIDLFIRGTQREHERVIEMCLLNFVGHYLNFTPENKEKVLPCLLDLVTKYPGNIATKIITFITTLYCYFERDEQDKVASFFHNNKQAATAELIRYLEKHKKLAVKK